MFHSFVRTAPPAPNFSSRMTVQDLGRGDFVLHFASADSGTATTLENDRIAWLEAAGRDSEKFSPQSL